MAINKKRMTLALLVLAIGAATVWALESNRFTPPAGTPNMGWYWMRTPGATAEWSFPDPGVTTMRNCELRMKAAVTQDINGGSGHDKTVDLTLTSGTITETITFLLNNPAKVTMPHSQGQGYDATYSMLASTGGNNGQKLLRICNNWATTKNLKARYVWKATRESCCSGGSAPHHVAVVASTVQVIPR